jgi:hypothetical protein
MGAHIGFAKIGEPSSHAALVWRHAIAKRGICGYRADIVSARLQAALFARDWAKDSSTTAPLKTLNFIIMAEVLARRETSGSCDSKEIVRYRIPDLNRPEID